MRRLALAFIVATLACPSPALAAHPPDDPELAEGLHCTERVVIPTVENVYEAYWSPDSSSLLVSWFGRILSARSVAGYREQEITDTLDLRDGRLWPVGVGDHAQWSATGNYISYWSPTGDELRVTTSKERRQVALLFPTVPDVRWVGDGLVFIEKSEIREWRDGAVRTIARISEDFVPKYPRDDVYWSPDAQFFTLTRYSLDGTLLRFFGTTLTGEVTRLESDAKYIEWAPKGHLLLLRSLDQIELRDYDGAPARFLSLASRGITHTWSPEGTLLLGTVSPTVPGGDVFDDFRTWDQVNTYRRGTIDVPAIATIPNVLGARAYSPDGKYFAGVSRTASNSTRLEVYRCRGAATQSPRADPEARTRLAKIDAGTGRLVRPTSGVITQFLQGSHTGVDVAAPIGSLIAADDDGVVTGVGWVAVGGNRVCVQHAALLESCYYHTSAPLVAIGERVLRGQPVALIGMTGVTTGPHTHWETKLGGRIVDPLAR